VIYRQTASASAAHAFRIVLHTVPRVGRSYELFPDGFYLHLLPCKAKDSLAPAPTRLVPRPETQKFFSSSLLLSIQVLEETLEP
jgi:hypothetical protein